MPATDPIHDRTAAGLFDQGSAGLDAAQGAGDIDLEDPIPLVESERQDVVVAPR
jgi:hypothetical protein